MLKKIFKNFWEKSRSYIKFIFFIAFLGMHGIIIFLPLPKFVLFLFAIFIIGECEVFFAYQEHKAKQFFKAEKHDDIEFFSFPKQNNS